MNYVKKHCLLFVFNIQIGGNALSFISGLNHILKNITVITVRWTEAADLPEPALPERTA